MELKRIFTVIVFSMLIIAGISVSEEVGQVITPWEKGGLDIHFINTGRGEASFSILPDGTTLIVDAGAMLEKSPRLTQLCPNASRSAGEWIVRYIKNLPGNESITSVNYAMLTHFHDDHMGDITEECPFSKSKSYRLSGITEVAEHFKLDKIIDRDWPNYNYPIRKDKMMVNNYRDFVDWQIKNNNITVEKFQAGRNDQIVLLNEPDAFDNFEIRNVAVNGEIWTGVGNVTRKHFPDLKDLSPEEYPNENMCSIVFRMSYGKFDFYNGGDINGVVDYGMPLWNDQETPVAQAIGPVDVMILDHHGYVDSQNAFFLSVLRPRVQIIPVWSADHPCLSVLRRLLSEKIYPGPRDIFATNMMQANKTVIGDRLEQLKSDQGHILIRVADGGDTYKIIIIDDSSESYKIKDVFGPYESR